jgi:hypothetical protein
MQFKAARCLPSFSMNIIIPVTPADQKLFAPLAKLLVQFFKTSASAGPWAEGAHKIFLLSSSRVVWTAEDKDLLESFRSGLLPEGTFIEKTIPADLDQELGWPRSPNRVFLAAVRLSGTLVKDEKPWYFFELDNTPLTPSWADVLQRAYDLGVEQYGARFLGVLNETRMVRPGVAGDLHGKHLVGTSVYPFDFYRTSKLAKHVSTTGLPFDVFLQGEIVRQARATTLIQHNWATAEYQRDLKTGQIVCKVDKNGRNTQQVDRYAKPIAEGAVVLHGCKDGSLAELVANEFFDFDPVEREKPKLVKPKSRGRQPRFLADDED